MNKKILIVDDEEEVLEILKEAFDRAGYKALTAAAAEEALEVLARENIQVMFLDLKLPGMSGLELCRRVKAKNPVAIIYAVTAFTSLFELADCRGAGFDDYFSKPAELDQLIKAADDAFHKLDRWIGRL